jgi:hypothetical protein
LILIMRTDPQETYTYGQPLRGDGRRVARMLYHGVHTVFCLFRVILTRSITQVVIVRSNSTLCFLTAFWRNVCTLYEYRLVLPVYVASLCGAFQCSLGVSARTPVVVLLLSPPLLFFGVLVRSLAHVAAWPVYDSFESMSLAGCILTANSHLFLDVYTSTQIFVPQKKTVDLHFFLFLSRNYTFPFGATYSLLLLLFLFLFTPISYRYLPSSTPFDCINKTLLAK